LSYFVHFNLLGQQITEILKLFRLFLITYYLRFLWVDKSGGVNVGPGATLQLSKSMDIIMKTKYHMIFSDGGSRSFVVAMGGLEFKF
jgi:hypothetical protein